MKRRRGKLAILFRVVLGLAGVVGVLLAIGAVVVTVIGMPTYEAPTVDLEVEATPERVAKGKRLVGMLCRRCHYDHNLDRLAGRELVEIVTPLGDFRAPNITRDEGAGIGDWSAGEIALLLRTGLHPRRKTVVPPPAMPRWPKMADDDLHAIIAFLQSDDPWVEADSTEREPTEYSLMAKTKALLGWSPLAYPRQPITAPSPDEFEKRGAYLVDDLLMCSTCHGEEWGEQSGTARRGAPGYLGGGASASDINGVVLYAANLTPHATGLADWTSAELSRVLVDGFGPDGKVVRWPTHRMPGLEQREVDAMHAYLQTVTPVENQIEESPPYKMVGRKAAGGRHLYLSHGCHYCHGHAGDVERDGLVDFRGLDERFPTDDALIRFLNNPAKVDAHSPMPSWEGIIAADEYDELIGYLRELGRRPPPAEG